MAKYPEKRLSGFKNRWPNWTDEERFLTHVKKTETCWLWQGAKHSKKGYGSFMLKGKTGKAHRAAWYIYRGNIPDKMFVCHSCDIPSCVNPEHLFLGTNIDNMRDMVDKGRSRKCAHLKNRKLTDVDVRQIRKDQRLYKIIAKDYNVHHKTIERVKARKIYPEVMD